MKTSSMPYLLALTSALTLSGNPYAQSQKDKTYTPDYGDVRVKTVALTSPKGLLSMFAIALPNDLPPDKRITLASVKTAGKLSPDHELILFANPGKNFKVEITAKFNIPVPTKLASNLLLEKAKILDEEIVKELKDHHNLTWHFDTESRLGYGSVENEGEITFDLIGKAPKQKGTFTFDLNVGLFDKISWSTKVMKNYKVTLITDPKLYDEAAPVTMTPSDEPLPWTASDGRVIQAKFVRLQGDAVVIEKDGQQHAVPFSKLNSASVEQAKKMGGI